MFGGQFACASAGDVSVHLLANDRAKERVDVPARRPRNADQEPHKGVRACSGYIADQRRSGTSAKRGLLSCRA